MYIYIYQLPTSTCMGVSEYGACPQMASKKIYFEYDVPNNGNLMDFSSFPILFKETMLL